MRKPVRSLVVILALVALIAVSPAAATKDAQSQGWLGVLLDGASAPAPGGDVTAPPSDTAGAVVRGIVDGSPADEMRLRAKDTIVAVDGAAVGSPAELIDRLRGIEPGSFVTLSVKRSGHDLELSGVLDARSNDRRRWRMVRGWLGVEAIELPQSLREHFGAPEDSGVLVSRVVEGSPAEDAGIRVGDVVYEADGQPVTSVGALSQIVSEAGVENDIDVVLARDGARIVVQPRIARASQRDDR
jgi:serine protease Do